MPRKPTPADRRKTAGTPTATPGNATSIGPAARSTRKAKVPGPAKGEQPAAHRRAGKARPAAGAPVPAPSPPDISIDIDPVVWGGRINGRFDVQIRGRVVSSETIEEIELLADGILVSRVRFGQPERLTGQSRTGQWDFQFSLPRLQEYANIRCPCVIRARTGEGRARDEPFEVLVDLRSPDPVKARFQPTQRGVGHDETRPPILCYVERAALDVNGNFEMCGWTVALAPIVTAQVLLEGDSRALAADIGGLRGDVAKAYPGYPYADTSGFVLAARTDPNLARTPTSATLQMFSLDGCSQEVTIPLEYVASLVETPPTPAEDARDRPVPDPVATEQDIVPGPPGTERSAGLDSRRQIHFFCDHAGVATDGTVRVTGWAVSAVGIASVGIYLDGEKIGDAELGLPRTDVGDAHSEIPMARFSGFAFEMRVAEIGEGEHDLWIAVHNGMGDVFSATRLVHAHILAEPDAGAAEAAPIRPGPEPATDLSEFRFSLDNPLVVAGSAVNPITGRLTIEGWAMARSGVTSITVYLDEQRLGEAHCGLARQDVATAYPDWAHSLRSGFAFHCPPRSLLNGKHVIRLILRASNGQEMRHSFQVEIRRPEGDDDLVNIRRRMTRRQADMAAELLREMDWHPTFGLILRQVDVSATDGLRATLRSLDSQVYPAWHLTIIADDAAAAEAVRDRLADLAVRRIEQISVVSRSEAAGDLSLAGTDGAPPSLFGVLCPGDELGCDALAEIALASGVHREADFLYADEARRSPVSRTYEPFFKPAFSPDLLLSTNYIGRPWFALRELMQRCGITNRDLLQNGEYDLVLRLVEQAGGVHRVPKLLARRGPDDVDDDVASRAALDRAAKRRGFSADVTQGCVPGTFRLRRTRRATGKVSIIIPTCGAHGHVRTCITTLRGRTAYKNFEIVCIDDVPDSQMALKLWVHEHADKVVTAPGTFNWSRYNNLAADMAEGEFLLFLNDDTEIEEDDWLDALLEHAQRPEVGIVGPLLLYPDRGMQHAGMFLGAGIGRHAFRFAPETEPGYFGLALTQRNVIAVTGACMLVRRSLFNALGRFEEAHSVINNDLDFCLRAHEHGKHVVYTPYAKLIHHELASRESINEVFDTKGFDSRWRTLFASGDPYFSPRLSRHSDDYRPDDEPAEEVFAGNPLFRAEEIRRILVVKLDHIGDFITALPAIRRLKELFPQASITVLAGRAARAFAALEPCIDEFLEFEFFYARSQLGEKQLTSRDLEELGERLAPYRFDIAVDMRKHLSTRDVLRHTGARFLAGYDYMGQFPFLDIALEWDGDRTLHRKRGHVVDDLLELAGAIGVAGAPERGLLAVTPARLERAKLPRPLRALFRQPVVAMHPGAGNITKQWPPEYFIALILLLLERNGVNVLLVGGPDEKELADLIMAGVARPDRIGSVAGQLPLAELPRMLAGCRLYIGNDSGPKHVAAAVGVPTIGIHSGVVDASEWGPVGRRAVALQRAMICSPCYLEHAEDCPRDLACLTQLEPSVVHRMAEQLLAQPVSPPQVQALNEVLETPRSPPKRRTATSAKPKPRRRLRVPA